MTSNKKQVKPSIGFRAAVWIAASALLISAAATAYCVWQDSLWWIVFGTVALLLLVALIFASRPLTHISEAYTRYLTRIARRLSPTDQAALEFSPFPILSVSQDGSVIWYNRRFWEEILRGEDRIGTSAADLLSGVELPQLDAAGQADVTVNDKRYTVLASKLTMDKTPVYLLYYWNDTDLKQIADEYEGSRPVALSIYIDNLDDLVQTVRDSERVQIAGQVETLLEDWIGNTTGVICKYESGRFLAVVEHRHIHEMTKARFPILDQVRQLRIGEVYGLTLSIGVGEGETLRDSVTMSRQALEMALGRGGDQAAVKTGAGFDFYGGATRDVERRTQVRSRVIASALKEVIEASEQVMLMGHRYSDADCLGASMALAAAVRSMGKPAFVALDRSTTLAPDCLLRYTAEEQSEWFPDEKAARALMTPETLLIVCDTHNVSMLEFPSLYGLARNVVVIDHHRKMVEHIDDAMIFYHEPYASSCSEMVTELLSYMAPQSLVRREAEGLLAGIVLDTHNFVLKSGVRTFEAAALLKKAGADTVSVKRMLSGNMELYRAKTEILSHAQVKDGIAMSYTVEKGKQERLAAAQAADELLSIQDVEAAFVLLQNDSGVNISARSYGEFNVHLTMEQLGGGGHMTMAGTHIPNITLDAAREQLWNVIIAQREQMAARAAERDASGT